MFLKGGTFPILSRLDLSDFCYFFCCSEWESRILSIDQTNYFSESTQKVHANYKGLFKNDVTRGGQRRAKFGDRKLQGRGNVEMVTSIFNKVAEVWVQISKIYSLRRGEANVICILSLPDEMTDSLYQVYSNI